MKKIIVLLAALIFTVSACTQKKTEDKPVRTVKIDTVRVYSEKSHSTFPGKVRAASDVNLAFRISGPIGRMAVETGSFVRKGQVLAELDSRDYTLQLSATEAEYNRIKAEAERVIALYEKGSATPNDYDKAKFGLQQITAKYEAHKNALNDTKLCAPFDGHIQKRFFEAGETIGAGMPVISMISADLPEVEIYIPASDFIQRDRFEAFFCEAVSFPGKVFPLELVGITQKANLNQLYTMRLKIKDKSSQLPVPGMTVMVTALYKPEDTDKVYIPLSALFESDGVSSIWVFNTNSQTVEKRAIKVTKILSDGKAILSDGLKEGEIVVTAGVHALQSGEIVRLLPTVSATNIGGLL